MSTIKFEAAPLPTVEQAQSTSEGLRKKRKRATAQGAADDCFTCLNIGSKCDRRRPYCSPCLEGGRDCAGYKTQLTWGIGVASRGKLRGLSLPVAGAQRTAVTSIDHISASKKRSTSNSKGSENSTPSPRSRAPTLPSLQTSRNDNNARFKISMPQTDPHSSIGSTLSQSKQGFLTPSQDMSQNDHIKAVLPALDTYHFTQNSSPLTTVFSPQTIISPSYEKHQQPQLSPYPTPSPSIQHYQPYPKPHQPPTTPTTHSYSLQSNPVSHSHTGYYQRSQPFFHTQNEHVNQHSFNPPLVVQGPHLPTMAASGEDDIEEIDRNFGDNASPDTALPLTSNLALDSKFSFPLSGSNAVGKNPRMQYLIHYYAEVISPVIVAFDSPTNPLRSQIISLATRSESLQHAISALCASNIRQRKESGTLSTGKTPGARRSSYMHISLSHEAWDSSQHLTIEDRKREETIHKNIAVRMLNQQLADPQKRLDDSVLATLLMLCLFHVCDSGIARFQTQFAGVKKLLSLRGNNYNGSDGNTKWMTRMFTMFDAIAATVNDREGQIDGQYIDISAQADDEWPYETLSGIDSRLFKPMSRLGRLNVLAQGKSPESNPTVVSRPLPGMPQTDNHRLNNFTTFDGNGWMRLLSDEELFTMKTTSSTPHEQFWREWREVRHELQMWTFDNTRFDGYDPWQPYLTPEQRLDTSNISESFRYSALLYTERLAHPNALSTDPKIQDWVQKSLYHIKQVRADVYLLWPLFITGSECGEEQERNIIRERCLDIQSDSGFMNNSTCLTLLEKVWRGDSATDVIAGEQSRPCSPFKFRDIMIAEGNGGEWIVV